MTENRIARILLIIGCVLLLFFFLHIAKINVLPLSAEQWIYVGVGAIVFDIGAIIFNILGNMKIRRGGGRFYRR